MLRNNLVLILVLQVACCDGERYSSTKQLDDFSETQSEVYRCYDVGQRGVVFFEEDRKGLQGLHGEQLDQFHRVNYPHCLELCAKNPTCGFVIYNLNVSEDMDWTCTTFPNNSTLMTGHDKVIAAFKVEIPATFERTGCVKAVTTTEDIRNPRFEDSPIKYRRA